MINRFAKYKLRHKEEIKQKMLKRKKERLAFLIAIKSVPCFDCKNSFPPCVMDFDHVRGDKKYNVSRLVQKDTSLERLKEEIAKCDVLCANCHRLRTSKTYGWYEDVNLAS